MRTFRVEKPTGYTAQNRVLIFDADGQPFYRFETNKGTIKFNLPKGSYMTASDITELPRPHKYEFKRTRKREFFNYTPPRIGDLKIEFADNPNKASVYPKKHLVVIDNSFKALPKYCIQYLLAHEVGHYHYKTEEFCDEFAQELMLEKGFNKSQIEEAARRTLHAGHYRHKNCLHNLQNAKIK
jgi:hypothetical protein